MTIMTKEDAIQILSTRDAHGVLCGYTSGVTEALDMAIEALKEQEISNELQEYAYGCGYEHFFHECQSCEYRRIGNKIQDWIPCSERLPEEREWIGTKSFGTTKSDTILITFDVDGTRFVKPLSLQNGKLSRADAKTMDAFYKGWKMLAWMPFPQPYREDGEA